MNYADAVEKKAGWQYNYYNYKCVEKNADTLKMKLRGNKDRRCLSGNTIRRKSGSSNGASAKKEGWE